MIGVILDKMKIVSFIKHNSQYKGLNFPEEDSFKYILDEDKIVVAVADGITRDPLGINILPSLNDLESIKKAAANYPSPSPAKEVANLFCKSFLEKFSFKEANKEIREYNKNKFPKVDFLENDFAGCVAIGGFIKNQILSYSFIADCGLAIFDKKGNLKFKTNDEGPNKQGSIDEDVAKKYKTSFKFPEGRKIIRSKYRNNPNNPLSYGALTGELAGEIYVRKGEVKISMGDYVIFYSDGATSVIFSDEFNILNEFNNLEYYFEKNSKKINGGEATIVGLHLI